METKIDLAGINPDLARQFDELGEMMRRLELGHDERGKMLLGKLAAVRNQTTIALAVAVAAAR